jgi:SAM-dependent methyltransferase
MIGGMRIRLVLLAGIALGVIVVGRRRAAFHAGHGGPGSGWASCSAPSAAWYEAVFGAPLRGLQQQVAADLVASTADDLVHDILEIGPGPGILAVEIARLAPSVRITGLDIDPSMVERASRRATDEGLDDRMSFLAGDVASLPFPDASFDLVTSTFSAHHWTDAPAGFAEIRRVLRPHGRAIVYDLPDWWGRLEQHARPLRDVAAAGGIEAASSTVFRWPWRIPLATRLEFGAPTPGEAG